MQILLYVLPVLAFAGIFLVAVSRKSGPGLRLAARIALVLAALSLLVCSAFVFFLRPAAGRSGAALPLPGDAKPAVPPELELIIFFAFLVSLSVLVIALAARRERSRKGGTGPR